ncbi:hypothetical protein OROMI_006980 [Orobanche minor]
MAKKGNAKPQKNRGKKKDCQSSNNTSSDEDFVIHNAKRQKSMQEVRSKLINDMPQKNWIVLHKPMQDSFEEGNVKEVRSKLRHDRPQKDSFGGENMEEALNKKPGKQHVKKSNLEEPSDRKGTGKGKKLHVVKEYRKLRTRTSPFSLVTSFGTMTDEQKAAVRSLGFELILRLSITDIPSRLAYWVVDKFDPCSCELVLENGKSIHVEPIDVHRVLGFPMGKILITKSGRDAKCNILNEWMGQFKNKNGKIGQKEIVQKMLEDKKGGIWFKRHFMVLLVSSLIENTSHGYVYPAIMPYLGELDRVKDLDWCTYNLNCLSQNKRASENEKHKGFLGSSLFLTILYVDRVSVFGIHCERAFPAFINWNNQRLRSRQKDEIKDGRLGRGFPVDPIQVPVTSETVNHIDAQNGCNEADTNSDDATNEAKYAHKLFDAAKELQKKMVELMEMIEKAPKLFWGSAEILKCLFDADKSYKMRKASITRDDDLPSFILGLTQLLNDEECQDLNTIVTAATTFESETMLDAEAIHKDELATESINRKGKKKLGDMETEVELIKDVENETVQDAEAIQTHDLATESINTKGKKKLGDMETEVELIKDVENETVQVVRRETRQRKRTDKFCSPFLNRMTKLTERLTKNEREVAYYVMHNSGDCAGEIIFKYGDVTLRRSSLMSLRPTMYALAEVIDVWSIILNEKENLRAKESPYRFFATVYATVTSISEPCENWTEMVCRDWFCDNLMFEMRNVEDAQVAHIDLFFFPIHKDNHFYLICIDVKKSHMSLIDNANVNGTACNAKKYGNIPDKLKTFFAEFLRQKGYLESAEKVDVASVEVVSLPWVEHDNQYDCGIYTMRHMETYMGEMGKKWMHGLNRKSRKQLRYLRARYCASIAASECNEQKNEIVDLSESYCSLFAEKKASDLESSVIN